MASCLSLIRLTSNNGAINQFFKSLPPKGETVKFMASKRVFSWASSGLGVILRFVKAYESKNKWPFFSSIIL